jgi:ABC-3C biological conflict system middle component
VIAWRERPRLVAHFLNPALMAAIASACAAEYEKARREPMPWVLLFLAAPLVLHGPSRRTLPPNTRTHLSTWVARNPVIRSGFAGRARALSPQVKDGVRYGVRCGALIVVGRSLRGRSPSNATGQVGELLRAARLVGRWFAKVDRAATAYALFGISP